VIGARQRAGEMGGPGRAARKGPGRGRGARLWPAQMAGARCTGWIGPSRAYTRACRRARGSEGGPTPVAFAEAGREPTPTRTVGRRAGADQCREAIASPGAGPRIAVRAHRATAGACGVTRGHDRGARADPAPGPFPQERQGGRGESCRAPTRLRPTWLAPEPFWWSRHGPPGTNTRSMWRWAPTLQGSQRR